MEINKLVGIALICMGVVLLGFTTLLASRIGMTKSLLNLLRGIGCVLVGGGAFISQGHIHPF